jgi:hypothetical protein
MIREQLTIAVVAFGINSQPRRLSAGVARNPPNSRANHNAENALPVIGGYSPIERKRLST